MIERRIGEKIDFSFI